MAYRIPSEGEIVKAIENCLVRTPHIRSQNELYHLVSTELLCMDEGYRVSGDRIRRVGIKHALFDLEIRYAHSDDDTPDSCPVCGGDLKSVNNMTLYGETVELRRKCGVCGYAASSDASRPARYIITRRIRMDERRELLERAMSLLEEAADLMDRGLRMSGMESRSGDDSDTVRRIASDPSYGGSLANILRDMEYMTVEHPCWTCPLDSVKYHPALTRDDDRADKGI